MVRKTAQPEFACRLFKVRGRVLTYDRAAEPGVETIPVCEHRTSD